MGAGLELSARRRDGSEFPAEISLSRLATEEGVVVLAAVRDVSARKRAEAVVQSLVEAAPDAIVGVDAGGVIRLVNRQAEIVFGWPRADLVGRSIDALVPDAARPRHPGHREGYFSRPRTRPMGAGLELSGRRRDGTEFPAEISLSVLETDDGRLAVAAVRDVTERKLIERERDALRRRQSERLESLGQLAGGVAHDFNNLLAVILSYARFSEDALADRPDVQADVREIRRAAERAKSLTHQLLIFGRREVTNPEILDVGMLIADVVALLDRALGDHVELEVRAAEGLWPVEADRGQLEQVLVNLAVNARDAMRDGGRLVIETANIRMQPGTPVAHGEVTQERYVRIDVSDTGCGMAPDIAERVFEPFFTTKPKGEGTGLGLATVYGIVLGAGGFLEVRSAEGEGTRFGVCLPAAPDDGEHDAAEAPGEAEALPAGAGRCILLVEDEPAVREVIRRILDAHGYRVHVARDPEHALQVCADSAQDLDLLVSDVVMPRMLGPELAAAVHELRPGLPVLFVSGYSYDVMRLEGRLAEDVPMVAKPFTAEALLGAVRDVLGP
jgi:PAS domain S-box-containing protein